MKSDKASIEKVYIHNPEFHIPEDNTKRALGEVAVPVMLVGSKDVPFSGTPVARPGDIASRGVRHVKKYSA